MSAMRCLTIPVTAVCIILAALSPSSGGEAEVDDRFRSLAAEAGQDEPLLRIGLDTGTKILVSSARRFRILDPATGKPAWRRSYDAEVAVVAEGAGKGAAEPVYRIQVAAFSSEEAAEAERERLTARFGVPGVVRRDPDRGNWRVRLGLAKSREGLSGLMTTLREAGLSGLWIAGEPAREVRGVTLRIVDTATYESHATGLHRLAVISVPAGRVRIEGKPYRGVQEIRVSPYGTVRAVNWIDLEQYLRGVVPAELGPEVWPQLEALKAQAVAARTYVWRHLGQFEDEGFDLCATPRCQVYKGRSAEHPLTDRAIEETEGQILTWEGEPITAMYTATCGGHTENSEEMFVEEKAPYLRGVPCVAEAEVLGRIRSVVAGRKAETVVSETGNDVTRDAALLGVAGVFGRSRGGPGLLQRPLSLEDLQAWTAALAALAGIGQRSAGEASTATLGEAALALVRAVGWGERLRLLVAVEDLPALIEDTGAEDLPEPQRRALAYLTSEGMLRPFPGGGFRAGDRPQAARFVPALARIGELYRAFGLREGTVSSMEEGRLKIFRGKRAIELDLGEAPVLFGISGEVPVPVEELRLWPGDRIRYRRDGRGKVDFLERIQPVKGVSDDRTAAVYSWKARKSRKELEVSINRRVDIGRLQDLQVVRRGVSGRVVELRAVGSKASTVVTGFDIRNILDLRELLVVIEPQRDGSGKLNSVVFSGKGWGHGVGMCQVGAYGMALRGKDYREILFHYYTGVSLERIDLTKDWKRRKSGLY